MVAVIGCSGPRLEGKPILPFGFAANAIMAVCCSCFDD
jgi:hypothetical protein